MLKNLHLLKTIVNPEIQFDEINQVYYKSLIA